jgi:DNA-directed RNA polymerase subunit RPC12/RpoP
LKGHISLDHEKNQSYKCPICDVIFAVNISLKGHISSGHEKKSYKCPNCDARFAENINLK